MVVNSVVDFVVVNEPGAVASLTKREKAGQYIAETSSVLGTRWIVRQIIKWYT